MLNVSLPSSRCVSDGFKDYLLIQACSSLLPAAFNSCGSPLPRFLSDALATAHTFFHPSFPSSNPHLLPCCGHTFCLSCIDRLASSLPKKVSLDEIPLTAVLDPSHLYFTSYSAPTAASRSTRPASLSRTGSPRPPSSDSSRCTALERTLSFSTPGPLLCTFVCIEASFELNLHLS